MALRLEIEGRARGLCKYCKCPSNCSSGPLMLMLITSCLALLAVPMNPITSRGRAAVATASKERALRRPTRFRVKLFRFFIRDNSDGTTTLAGVRTV